MSVLLVVAAFGIACLAAYFFSRLSGSLQIFDRPNERSLHSTPVPRTGGLAIWAGVVMGIIGATILLDTRLAPAWLAGSVLLIGIVSFIDDWCDVSIAFRLAIHLLASGLLLIDGLELQSFWLPGVSIDVVPTLGIVISILFVVWMTNLYNFMDGIDGFAGGMGVIGFGVYAAAGWVAGDNLFFIVNAIVAGSVAGFLIFNFPPARLFMGDVGSSALGFLAGAAALWANRDNILPLWAGILVFSPFIVDASVTLVVRLWRQEKIWKAHKGHYYQRLVQSGWGHRKTTLTGYVLMASCAISALVAIGIMPCWQWGIIGFWTIFYILIILIIERKVRSLTT